MANPSASAKFVEASDRSLLVVLGEEIDLKVHRKVAALSRSLLADPLPGVFNIHPAYASILIDFAPLAVSATTLTNLVTQRLATLATSEAVPLHHVEIPVCYGEEFGPDLAACAKLLGMGEKEIISLHSGRQYSVFFLGFTPGFPYMGILPEVLAAPRLGSPRTNVPAGSVAIAGRQTGIYPASSPGGWRIIGRTPLAMFDQTKKPCTLLAIGDSVTFTPIDRGDFLTLQGEELRR